MNRINLTSMVYAQISMTGPLRIGVLTIGTMIMQVPREFLLGKIFHNDFEKLVEVERFYEMLVHTCAENFIGMFFR